MTDLFLTAGLDETIYCYCHCCICSGCPTPAGAFFPGLGGHC